MNREELIEQKKAEIAKLEAGLVELQDKSIGSRVKVSPFTVGRFGGEDVVIHEYRWGDVWEKTIRLSMWIFRQRFDEKRKPKIYQKDMTPEQKKTAAEFCDEVFAIYNRYILEEYPEYQKKGGDHDD